ncbi:SDR family oxidoreductase [Marinifilum caeruleilacunae]|uniref:SDR family oxidoreductase n=1 Tax=Marinifilum caeruleilacunae TaxID=2499076 RepID=A0ABX1WQY4_9BACT|nr:SDR family oxidoreductase [Marinifilum caeruleilacunae]NOU58354.1 SDR family oxidoreductase [Marinifilum caeruleilacunae]
MSKVILITGAGSGIGKLTALGLAKNGHKVIATVHDWPQVTLLKHEASEKGLDLIIEKLEYTNKADHETVIRKYGEQTDILILNAATGETGPAAEIPVERFRKVFEINVFRTLELAQKFAALFVKRGHGKIMVTSSTAGLQTYPFLAPYTASKHAIEAIFQQMQQELEPLGVQVATINPGPFNTGFNDRMFETVDQWFETEKNFTPEKPLRDMQAMFADPNFQFDPQIMADAMVDIIPKESHKFRNVCPENFADFVKEYQANLWELIVTSEK